MAMKQMGLLRLTEAKVTQLTRSAASLGNCP